jgi:hypothetical protein
MGTLFYGGSRMAIPVDDRTLAHLQIVIGAKLRRREGFFFTWKEDQSVGGGRSTVWLDPAIPLHFKFSGSRQAQINREWLDQLANSSNSSQGLQLLDENVENPPATPAV